jgi:NAD(P)-dependent dehydrogenase (short-subunit alcohol dehydrogenase family)
MGKLDGKVALITGGTSGIGEACVRLFANEGADVIIVGRNLERGKVIEEDSIKNGKKAKFYSCDVTDVGEIENLYNNVIVDFGRLDILFNCSGILITSDLENITIDDWDKTFDTNTKSVMMMSQKFIDLIVLSKGNILNCASIDGLDCNIRGSKNYMYSSSKAATIHFTKYCALNYSNKIRVNCLCPGVTDTPLWTNRDFSRFNSSIPMGRVGRTEEIAKAALFLVSDDASYITGVALPVDGGAAIM